MRTAPSRVRLLALAASAVVVPAAGCGGDAPAEGSPERAGDVVDGTVTVFAAASLTEPFTELAARFEEAHPGADITLTFAGSSDLATQITEGAPADVFASADTGNLDRVAAADLLAGDAVRFATNTLELAVPSGNPAGISSLSDAARPGVKTVVCAQQVPCGAATAEVERAAGVDLTPVSEESSVADVLGKVVSGEADAGLVYVTDVRAAGDAVQGIPVPEAADAVTTYPIAALTDSKDAATAQAFVDYVTGTDGQAVLGAAGFGAP